jgi:Domain of Unknown Function (DUF748)
MPRRRALRRTAIALIALALLLVAARLALDPLVTWRTAKVLEGLDRMRGRFDDVEVSVHDLSYSIEGLAIEKLSAGGAALPYVSIDRAKLGLQWRELIRGHVVADVDLDRPTLNIVSAERREQEQEVEEAPEVGREGRKLLPFKLNRLQIRGGEVRWIDAREPEAPRLRLRGVEATVENFSHDTALSRGEPSVLAGRATLQKTGKVSVFVTADPLAKKLTFAGQGRLEGLRLAEIGALLGAKSDVAPDEGTLDMAIRFRADGGNLSGGVRPFLKDAGTRAAKPGLGPKLKSLLADAAISIFSDDVPGRNAVATTIPIEGTVDDPAAQVWPTVLGIVRNGFVRGLSDSLSGLPPPKAEEKEGKLEQARRALSSKRGNQPRAQPERKE